MLSRHRRDNQGGLFRTQIRALLKAHPEGLTVKEVMTFIEGKNASIYRAIKRMPDAYCAGWERVNGGKVQAVFRVAHVPENCPQPLDLPRNYSIRQAKPEPMPTPSEALAAVLVKPKKLTPDELETQRRAEAFKARYVTPFKQTAELTN